MRTYTIEEGEDCYIYQAAFLCARCGEYVRAELREIGSAPDDENDETMYDSDDFPKGPFEAEQDETCDSMDECLSL